MLQIVAPEMPSFPSLYPSLPTLNRLPLLFGNGGGGTVFGDADCLFPYPGRKFIHYNKFHGVSLDVE